jgi:hypothetical protein
MPTSNVTLSFASLPNVNEHAMRQLFMAETIHKPSGESNASTGSELAGLQDQSNPFRL